MLIIVVNLEYSFAKKAVRKMNRNKLTISRNCIFLFFQINKYELFD